VDIGVTLRPINPNRLGSATCPKERVRKTSSGKGKKGVFSA
jgi:hypothetical protein